MDLNPICTASVSTGPCDSFGSALPQGAGASTIAKATGLTRPTVQRLQEDMAGAEAVLVKWSKAVSAERAVRGPQVEEAEEV